MEEQRVLCRIEIKTPFIKLDSLLKYAELVDSGGCAKALIQDGKVAVNTWECRMRGRKIYPGDIVSVGKYDIMVFNNL